MLTRFKLFEKLGIDNLVVEISDKIWSEFQISKKKYDARYAEKNKQPGDFSFNVDVSKYKLVSKHYNKKNPELKYIKIDVYENNAESSCTNIAFENNKDYFCLINIGLVSREDNNLKKSVSRIKDDIIHETQHIVDTSRKLKLENSKHRFLNNKKVSSLFYRDVFGAFSDEEGNISKLKKSTDNFLLYNKFTDQYKNLLIYLYFANDDELSSRLHEIYSESKDSKNLEDFLKRNSRAIGMYKKLMNFKLNLNLLSLIEKEKVKEMFNPKDTKKVEKYINQQGEKFVRKTYKLVNYNENN